MNRPPSPQILFTVGDVNGIGPEVLLKGLRSDAILNSCAPVVIGNQRLLADYRDALAAVDPEFGRIEIGDGRIVIGDRTIPIVEIQSDAQLNLGEVDSAAGKLAGDAIAAAVEMLTENRGAGMVTMPISKLGLNRGGYDWPGHTEMIASLSGGAEPLMILLTEGLRVALATIHVPLRSVPSLITPELLARRLQVFHDTLRQDFALDRPRIAVLGLNPHAGEDGSIGSEEEEIIAPLLKRLRADGIPADGPFPADGFFARYKADDYDGVLAMYHDQGLIPLKMFARGGGVNVTAGLPVVRTSPDHGTAYGIAGRGIADERSTIEATLCALTIRRSRGRGREE